MWKLTHADHSAASSCFWSYGRLGYDVGLIPWPFHTEGDVQLICLWGGGEGFSAC